MAKQRKKYNVYYSRERIRKLNSGGRPVVTEYYHVRDTDGNSTGYAGDMEGVKFLIRNDGGRSDEFVSEHYKLVMRGEWDWYWAFMGSERIRKGAETTGIRKPQRWEYELWIEEHRNDKNKNA